jgi:uncharacterized protein YkwD
MIRVLFFLLISTSAYSQGYVNARDMVLADINAARSKKGLKEVTYDESKQVSVDQWAMHITSDFRHGNYERGEVINSVYSPELIVPMFLKSDSHRAVLLDRKAAKVCISVYEMPEMSVKKGNSLEVTPRLFYAVIRTY